MEGYQCLLPPQSPKNTILSSQVVSHPSPQPSNLSYPPSFCLPHGRLIVTGGTAACVVASRLATADANLRILLLEAGPTTYNDPAHTQPVSFLNHLAPGSRTVREYVSRPSAALGGRTTTVPIGQCFGGSGSVNCMSYASSTCVPSFSRLILSPALVNYAISVSHSYDVHAPGCL
jgi:hypothetical protein